MLSGRSVVLGVTGGIAAYKAAMLTSLLVKAGAEVDVLMTDNACQFVTPLTFESLSGRPVITDTFQRYQQAEIHHIALAKKAEVMVIAPATANFMAKAAQGLADDMLTSTFLAYRGQKLIAPAMNTGMWENAATQENLKILTARGMRFIGPEGGNLACKDVGLGRMSEPQTIFDRIVEMLTRPCDMQGKKVMVTAGPTREALDPVRFLTNRSSGKMGYALAAAAAERGAQVTLVSGPTALAAPQGVEVINIQSTQDMYEAVTVQAALQDLIIFAAAPADFTADKQPQKIKKPEQGDLVLTLKRTPDIARAVGEKKKPGQILVGFAAETEKLIDHAEGKLKSKNFDMIVANDVTQPGAGFEGDSNIVTLITAQGRQSLSQRAKTALAHDILDAALQLGRG